MITFQKESFIKLMPELPAIFYAHWKEVALDQDIIPLDPDWDQYAFLEMNKMLHTMTVRDDGILIGYYNVIVRNHLHYKTTLHAWSDLVYLLPEYRNSGAGLLSTGYKLIRRTNTMLKKLGVKKSYLMTKSYIPLNMLTEFMNYRDTERIYTLIL